jgi:L-lactate dehydrogenase
MVDSVHSHQPLRIAVVGLGNVGASFAFCLLLRRIAAEIVLIDANYKKAEGEAMDLSHAVPFGAATRIWAGDFADCRGAAVVVITAGAAQRPGETRPELLDRNLAIFREVVPRVVEQNPDALLLIATNPVDVLSYASYKLSGLPARRVIGSGTILDTARFRFLLGQHFGVDPRSVHGLILGEHGDSEVPAWSLANIAGIRLRDYCNLHNLGYEQAVFDRIFTETRDAAYQIIERKGATYYAVAAGLLQIVEAIVRDQKTVLTTSTLVDDAYGLRDVYLSLPTVVGAQGIVQVLTPELSEDETAKLRHSAEVLRGMIAGHLPG